MINQYNIFNFPLGFNIILEILQNFIILSHERNYIPSTITEHHAYVHHSFVTLKCKCRLLFPPTEYMQYSQSYLIIVVLLNFNMTYFH